MGDNDIFTFDSPSLINVQGNFTVSAEGDGKIVIPAGVTVIIDGNVQLDAKNGGCDKDFPCTFTIVVNGSLQVNGSLKNNLVNLIWEGSGTVPVTDRLENSSNGCMSCGVTCPQFPDGPGGCVDSGNGCSVDFCSTIYGTDCQIDSIDPVIVGCPTDMSISTENNSCNAVVSWTEPTASDNCGISSFTSSHKPGDTFPLGITTVTYTANDNNGQTASCSFQIEVVDNVEPLINGCPGDITTSEIDPADNLATVSWNEPVASDNCALTSLTSTHQPGMKFPEGQTVVTYTALDDAGNLQTCSFTVIVNQNGGTIKEVLKAYKAFSPNGDGINDVWSIGGIEQYPENSVNIFDRWGSIVYEASGYNNEQVVWDGTGNSNSTLAGRVLPSGTYFYSIKIPEIGSLSGYVELVK
jgi:gliding motility-associated-like protein